MQFIENTRSRSSLIEYFRHFFIDMSIFGRHGGAPLERRTQSGVEPAGGRQAAPQERSGRKDGAALQKKSPTLTKRAWGTRQRTPGCTRRGRSKQRPYEGKFHAHKTSMGHPSNPTKAQEHRRNAPRLRGESASERIGEVEASEVK